MKMRFASVLVFAILIVPGLGFCGSYAVPEKGKIHVAFLISEGAVMIDFAGPWEVFQDVHVPSRGTTMDDQMPFQLYTVSDSRDPIRVSGGMHIVPDYTFEDAPAPKIIVIPA